jgi:hypothetical protein
VGIATSAWTAWPHATGEGGTAIAPGPLNEAYSPMEVRREVGVGDEARGTTGAVLGAWEPPWAPSWACPWVCGVRCGAPLLAVGRTEGVVLGAGGVGARYGVDGAVEVAMEVSSTTRQTAAAAGGGSAPVTAPGELRTLS